jgi:uncharacterized protein
MPLQLLLLLALGVLSGGLSGLIGIGGAIIIIPVLVLGFGLSQHMAQGTTIALMVPPIGLFAAYNYYKNGYVDLKIAVIISLGFIVGSWLSSQFAFTLPDAQLRKVFAVVLMGIGLKLFLGK